MHLLATIVNNPGKAALMATLPVYLVMAVGVIARRTKIMPQAADSWLLKLSIWVLFPALIISRMLGIESLRNVSLTFGSAGIGFFYIVVGVGVGLLVARLLGLEIGSGKRTFALSAGLQNFAYLGIPVMMSLFPGEASLGVLFTHNVGVEIAMWTIGMMLLTGSSRFSLKLLCRGPIIAVCLSLALLWTRGDQFVPPFVLKALSSLGYFAIPVSVLLVGTTLSDLWGKEKLNWKIAAGGVLARLVITPALMLLGVWLLPISLPLKQVLVVQAAVPSAVFPIVLAKHYGGRPGIAIQVVIATTIASILTIPITISLGQKIIALPSLFN